MALNISERKRRRELEEEKENISIMEDENYDDLEDVDELSSHLAKGLNSSHVLYLLRIFCLSRLHKKSQEGFKAICNAVVGKETGKKLILRKWS